MPNYIDPNRGILVGNKSFVASDLDTASDTKYYGFISADSSWIIMKEVTSAETFRFVGGHDDYATNFTNRASLSYDYYDQIWR